MPYIGEFAALGAAVLWSFSSVIFTTAAIKVGSLKINLSRLFIAALLLAITIVLLGVSYSVNFNQFLYFTISGFIGLVLGDSFLFKAFKEIGPRISMLVMSINPAIAAIFAFFFLGEDLSYGIITGIIVTTTGISLVVLERYGSNEKESRFKITRMGVIYAFLAAVGQAGGLILAKMAFLNGNVNDLVAAFYRIFTSVIIFTPFALFSNWIMPTLKLFKSDKKLLWIVIIGSILGPYLGITLSYTAIVHTKIGIASTLLSTSPILLIPISKFYYKDKITLKSIIGAIIAVLGVSILFLK